MSYIIVIMIAWLLQKYMKNDKKKKSFKEYWFFFVLVICVFVIFLICIGYLVDIVGIFQTAQTKNIPDSNLLVGILGQFGDSFNILTSLFTGLAFVGVILTIFLQHEELKATREELKGQREALEKQEEALEKQNEEMAIQTFDNKFFQLLNTFNATVNGLRLSTNLQKKLSNTDISTLKGREIFVYILSKYEHMVRRSYIKGYNRFIQDFDDLDIECLTILKYYFINLFQLLKYVDDSIVITDEKKKQYTNIIRAQLTTVEVYLLAFNAIQVIIHSGCAYKKFIEEYQLLEHIQAELFKSEKMENRKYVNGIILATYDEKAFGKNKSLKKFVEECKEECTKKLNNENEISDIEKRYIKTFIKQFKEACTKKLNDKTITDEDKQEIEKIIERLDTIFKN